MVLGGGGDALFAPQLRIVILFSDQSDFTLDFHVRILISLLGLKPWKFPTVLLQINTLPVRYAMTASNKKAIELGHEQCVAALKNAEHFCVCVCMCV